MKMKLTKTSFFLPDSGSFPSKAKKKNNELLKIFKNQKFEKFG